jgi:histidyl-tRNA synthetase
MSSKPSIPKGTRDFGPEKMARRNFIFSNIKSVFQLYGFLPLETPAMENLSVLTGKYGDEGDQLLFKILNSGDYLSDVQDISEGYKKLTTKISEKGLRYDLTVPFARYVVMNRNEITIPFKRYQMQPVWRADRPQKGRYREFYQCDADVVGTDSLICEAEIIGMLIQAFGLLGMNDFTIKINNRKILTGLAEAAGAPGKEAELCIAIDKLDKIGLDKVREELAERGFSSATIKNLDPIFNLSGNTREKLSALRKIVAASEIGLKGIEELETVFKYAAFLRLDDSKVAFDVTLARGLSYYTGAIFEVKANNVSMGSICGGGRYDNLTGAFGMPGLSGVGISFGIDRIYDVMEELKLFPESAETASQVLVANFDPDSELVALGILSELREAGVSSEIYPESAKLKKQLSYADSKRIPFTVIAGPEEIASGKFALRNMKTGVQESLSVREIIEKVKP